MSAHHSHQLDSSNNDIKNIRVAFFLNLIFTLIEIVGGLLTNSVAILSDALHDFGDSITLGMAWYFQKLSKKDSDKVFSYGYARFSLVGALISSVILIVGSVIIISEAIPRILNPEVAHAPGMMLLAVLGIIINGIAVLRLKKGNSMNERVIYLHLLEDVLGWFAVLIGAIVMYFFDIPIIDPILSLLIAAFILFNVYRNLKSTINIILQSIPSDIDLPEIQSYFESQSLVNEVNDLHVWSLDGAFNIMTIHLQVDDRHSLSDLEGFKKQARDHLLQMKIQHATFEFQCGKNEAPCAAH